MYTSGGRLTLRLIAAGVTVAATAAVVVAVGVTVAATVAAVVAVVEVFVTALVAMVTSITMARPPCLILARQLDLPEQSALWRGRHRRIYRQHRRTSTTRVLPSVLSTRRKDGRGRSWVAKAPTRGLGHLEEMRARSIDRQVLVVV